MRANEHRWEIVQRANTFRYQRHYERLATLKTWLPKNAAMPTPVLWGMKNLHEAVCVCRHNNLVAEGTLILAGFRPKRRR